MSRNVQIGDIVSLIRKYSSYYYYVITDINNNEIFVKPPDSNYTETKSLISINGIWRVKDSNVDYDVEFFSSTNNPKVILEEVNNLFNYLSTIIINNIDVDLSKYISLLEVKILSLSRKYGMVESIKDLVYELKNFLYLDDSDLINEMPSFRKNFNQKFSHIFLIK